RRARRPARSSRRCRRRRRCGRAAAPGGRAPTRAGSARSTRGVAAGLCAAAPGSPGESAAADAQRQDRPPCAARDARVPPSVDLTSFPLLPCPLLALVALGLLGLLRRPVVLGASLAIVVFQYGDPTGEARSLSQLSFLAAYVAGSIAVVLAYAAIR